jgi:NAD dependent epimerase/dehydratase family enzyme
MNRKVLITGGSGFIGKQITNLLQRNGYSVSILSRRGGNFGNLETFKWDPDAGTIDVSAFEDLFGIIHLAGASIADKKWKKGNNGQ